VTQSVTPPQVPASVGAAAKALLEARGDAKKLKRVFDASRVPMSMLDHRGRLVDMNIPGRLVSRRSFSEIRGGVVTELVPLRRRRLIEAVLRRLEDSPCINGTYPLASPDGGRFDVVYWGLANALPGLHVFVYAPASWPDDEFAPLPGDGSAGDRPRLTAREREVLQLAAEGLSGPRIAAELGLSPATVKTHLTHIYDKLDVRDRAAAVAIALRVGLID
jgi:DNA-binding CsgD family transcriptional regulator